MLNQRCILVVLDGWGYSSKKKYNAIADVAPTILSLYEIEKPASMSGENLLKY